MAFAARHDLPLQGYSADELARVDVAAPLVGGGAARRHGVGVRGGGAARGDGRPVGGGQTQERARDGGRGPLPGGLPGWAVASAPDVP